MISNCGETRILSALNWADIFLSFGRSAVSVTDMPNRTVREMRQYLCGNFRRRYHSTDIDELYDIAWRNISGSCSIFRNVRLHPYPFVRNECLRDSEKEGVKSLISRFKDLGSIHSEGNPEGRPGYGKKYDSVMYLLRWVKESELKEPVAVMTEKHKEGILNRYDSRISNGVTEDSTTFSGP